MKRSRLPILIFLLLIMSGCMYPQSELAKNQAAVDDQIEMVQQAVFQYREQTDGLLPIKTKPNDVSVYEKYLIDFTMLKEKQLISTTPATAYENGGFFQYVIITPEEDPRVKLIDLRTTEKLREINIKLDIYRQKNIYPPFGEQVAEGVFAVNQEKLGLKEEPSVISPFTGQNLPILMTTEGQLIIDYRIDLQLALEEFNVDVNEGEDIRFILEDNYHFVPAYSLSYTIDGDKIVFNY